DAVPRPAVPGTHLWRIRLLGSVAGSGSHESPGGGTSPMRGSMTHRVARHRRRVPGAFAVVALAAALAVAGCGNSSTTSNEASSSGGGTGSGPDPTLTVSLGQYTAVQPALFLGQALGLYKKAGVNVDFQLNGTDFATDVLAGRADVAISGPAGALAAAFQGKDTAVLAEVT